MLAWAVSLRSKRQTVQYYFNAGSFPYEKYLVAQQFYSQVELKILCPHKKKRAGKCSQLCHPCSVVEATRMFVSWWTDKQTGAFACSGILLNHKKRMKYCICYDADDPWKHVKWKKAVTKVHILWFYLPELSIIGRSKETERRLVIGE